MLKFKISLNCANKCIHRIPSSFIRINQKNCQFIHTSTFNFSNEIKLYKESKDENFDYKKIDLPRASSLRPLKDYDLLSKLDKVKKNGSFLANVFMGKFDKDFLKYPNVCFSRKEFLNLSKQQEMVRQHFNRLCGQPESEKTLQELGFFNLWMLSKTEMASIFESMGSSFSFPYKENNATKEIDTLKNENLYNENNLLLSSTHDLLTKLILHNTTGSCFNMADNKNLGNELKDILLTGNKIAFAWTEKETKLGSIPYNDWKCEAKLSEDKQCWYLNGEKTNILDLNYSHYLVFARTHHYPEDPRLPHLQVPEESNPGIVSLLVPRELVHIEKTEDSNSKLPTTQKYQNIKFDNILLPRAEHEIMEAEEFGALARSLRGIGHVNQASLILGLLKGLHSLLFEYMRTNKFPMLQSCELVKKKMCQLTEKIYTLESMVYMCSAMYDCFDLSEWPDMSLEASATKITAIEFARTFLIDMQGLFGSEMLQTSKFYDLFNLMDSLLDSSTHHRLSLALIGEHFVGNFKYEDVQRTNLYRIFPFHGIKKAVKNWDHLKDMPKLKDDFRGELHPTLYDSADQLEYCAKRLEFVAETLLVVYAKDIVSRQIDLDRLAQIAIDVFAGTCVVARASRSYSETLQNAEAEVSMARVIMQKRLINVRNYVHGLLPKNTVRIDSYLDLIHEKSLEFNGYFAYSPMDKLFY